MFCSHDCERCRFDDCICPEEEISVLEMAESRIRDRIVERGNCEADYDDEKKAADFKRRQMKREWYYAHRRAELKRKKEFRAKNRERLRAESTLYYATHKEEINARKREKRALERARKRAERNAQIPGQTELTGG